MARYIQRIKLLGKERWIGWEVDGVGTEIPGLILADEMSDEDIRERGVKEFGHLPFETFIGMGALSSSSNDLLDQDIDFRLDALQVGMERCRASGVTAIPRAMIANIFGDERHIEHPRVVLRFLEWQGSGAVKILGRDDCYLKIMGRLA